MGLALASFWPELGSRFLFMTNGSGCYNDNLDDPRLSHETKATLIPALTGYHRTHTILTTPAAPTADDVIIVVVSAAALHQDQGAPQDLPVFRDFHEDLPVGLLDAPQDSPQDLHAKPALDTLLGMLLAQGPGSYDKVEVQSPESDVAVKGHPICCVEPGILSQLLEGVSTLVLHKFNVTSVQQAVLGTGTELILDRCIAENGGQDLALAARGGNLETLVFNGNCPLGPIALTALLHGIAVGNNIGCQGLGFTDGAMRCILADDFLLLGLCLAMSQLKSLDLSGNEIDMPKLELLLEAFANSPTLSTFNLETTTPTTPSPTRDADNQHRANRIMFWQRHAAAIRIDAPRQAMRQDMVRRLEHRIVPFNLVCGPVLAMDVLGPLYAAANAVAVAAPMVENQNDVPIANDVAGVTPMAETTSDRRRSTLRSASRPRE